MKKGLRPLFAKNKGFAIVRRGLKETEQSGEWSGLRSLLGVQAHFPKQQLVLKLSLSRIMHMSSSSILFAPLTVSHTYLTTFCQAAVEFAGK